MKSHHAKGSKSASSLWVRTARQSPSPKGAGEEGGPSPPREAAPDPTATSSSLHAAGAATSPGWPERTRDSAASQRLSGSGLLHTLQGAGDCRHPPARPRLRAPAARSQGAGRPARGSEGWRRSRSQGAAGSRPGGGSGRSRSPARRPGRKEARCRRGRVLKLSPPRDPEPPTNSARRPRAPASVPGIACGRAGWCGRRGARQGEGLARGGARKLGRGGAGSGRLIPRLPGSGTRWVSSGAAGVTASGSPSLPGIP